MEKYENLKQISRISYRPESTISAINNTARYGLENLKSTHYDFSVGFATTQALKSIIKTPEAIAV